MNHDEILKRIAGLNPAQKEVFLRKLGIATSRLTQDSGITECDILPPVDCYACNFGTPGSLNITFREASTGPPSPGYVQVKARAASLNYRDLMIAMGQYPEAEGVPSNMGSDYAGIVTAVGQGVDEFRVGDEVIALSAGTFLDGQVRTEGHFISQFNVNRLQLVHKPRSLSFEQSATLPTVYLTAFSALIRHGAIHEGESVLVHTATGGVGLAAIEIARWKKAKVYATAGTPEKRSFLLNMGIEDPMDSRSTAFAGRILELTGGRGVDLVLNTLSGESLMKGLQILAPFGRFIQIDKKDIASDAMLPMGLLARGISFTVVDVSLYLLQPALLKEQLSEIAKLHDDGIFKPLPLQSWPVARLKDALTAMARSKHIGKLTLTYP